MCKFCLKWLYIKCKIVFQYSDNKSCLLLWLKVVLASIKISSCLQTSILS